MTDARRHAPATQRNRDPILAILRDALPAKGTVLEVASGTGEHAVYFAEALPDLLWQPSDADGDALRSIDAWAQREGIANVLPAIALNAAAENWPIDAADAIVCINMVHISPWEATVGMLRGAARILPQGAPLYLYGPYRRTDHRLEDSNAAFDDDLKSRDPRWGLRSLEEVAALADEHGFLPGRVSEMPANNLSVIFRRR